MNEPIDKDVTKDASNANQDLNTMLLSREWIGTPLGWKEAINVEG